MVILDTHVWIWWVLGHPDLPPSLRAHLDSPGAQAGGLGVSAISCWEVAKLVELGRLTLARPVQEWLELALIYPGVILLELAPQIAVESTRLPPPFHRDPADQIIVATARVFDCPLLTLDAKILAYSQVRAFSAPPPVA